jgi:hypothetical protein
VSTGRLLAAGFSAALISFVLSAIFTSDSFGYWWNAGIELLCFLAATVVAWLIVLTRVVVAVGLGFALTWGLVALEVLAAGSRASHPLSAWVLLGFIGVSLILAVVLQRSSSRSK